jgi:hypothetical protein
MVVLTLMVVPTEWIVTVDAVDTTLMTLVAVEVMVLVVTGVGAVLVEGTKPTQSQAEEYCMISVQAVAYIGRS